MLANFNMLHLFVQLISNGNIVSTEDILKNLSQSRAYLPNLSKGVLKATEQLDDSQETQATRFRNENTAAAGPPVGGRFRSGPPGAPGSRGSKPAPPGNRPIEVGHDKGAESAPVTGVDTSSVDFDFGEGSGITLCFIQGR